VNRRQRERLILTVIENEAIETQQDLVSALVARGQHVTQATVSRDIKRLGLVKVPQAGGYRYAAPSSARPSQGVTGTVQSFVTGMDQANAILLVKTLPGRASAVASAIDEVGMPEVAATLAGDDTVLVLVRNEEDRERVRRSLEEIL
jgi:transcriptional regulator of arginine metabolism